MSDQRRHERMFHNPCKQAAIRREYSPVPHRCSVAPTQATSTPWKDTNMAVATKVSAKVTPAYGMRAVGGFGIRGWRVHCPSCAHLSSVYTNVRGAQSAQRAHRCGR